MPAALQPRDTCRGSTRNPHSWAWEANAPLAALPTAPGCTLHPGLSASHLRSLGIWEPSRLGFVPEKPYDSSLGKITQPESPCDGHGDVSPTCPSKKRSLSHLWKGWWQMPATVRPSRDCLQELSPQGELASDDRRRWAVKGGWAGASATKPDNSNVSFSSTVPGLKLASQLTSSLCPALFSPPLHGLRPLGPFRDSTLHAKLASWETQPAKLHLFTCKMGIIVIGSPSLFWGLSIEEREDTGQCALSLVARGYHFLQLRTNRQLQDHTFLAIVPFLFPPIQPFFLGHPRTHTHSQHRVRPHNPERPFSVAANRPPCVSFLQSELKGVGAD
ncbi:uncharacterized protein LOC122221525 [Panthera leo]|uniref:uncharacterized protein LOC122221525 n=1 Tax=Panthera leo TaxID=9689 RepID=UPI001C6A1DFA|nr:uncharacterized protein LOC122221525 [Panthera leo]XP_042796765.1 uncharacterized protein LOC122221525 [Panthera leo]